MFAPLLVCCALFQEEAAKEEQVPTPAEVAAGAVPLNTNRTVLLDAKGKRVLVRSTVCLRGGSLEMLLCKPQTKEHESVLVFAGEAKVLHAGLIGIGLEPGGPVEFEPFKPPRGPKLSITAHWIGEDGRPRRADAKTFVRTSTEKWYERDFPALPAGLTLPEDLELRHDRANGDLIWYGPMSEAERDRALALSKDEAFREAIRGFYAESQPRGLTADFVFAGSLFFTRNLPPPDAKIGEEVPEERMRAVTSYAAEGGEVVCVANFQAATIDIAERSSNDGQGVLYEAATEAIPPEGTPVLLVFEAEAAAEAADAAKDDPADADAAGGASGAGDPAGDGDAGPER